MAKLTDLRSKGYKGRRPFQVDCSRGRKKRKRFHFHTKKEAERFLAFLEAERMKQLENEAKDLIKGDYQEKGELVDSEGIMKSQNSERSTKGMAREASDLIYALNHRLGQARELINAAKISWQKNGKKDFKILESIMRSQALLNASQKCFIKAAARLGEIFENGD
jgi:hypothetical protein